MHLVPVERSGKWGVASALYAGSKYPAYAKGGGYVLSALAAVRIVEAVRTGLSPLLSNVEDAMVGLAAAALNISATHVAMFRELPNDYKQRAHAEMVEEPAHVRRHQPQGETLQCQSICIVSGWVIMCETVVDIQAPCFDRILFAAQLS